MMAVAVAKVLWFLMQSHRGIGRFGYTSGSSSDDSSIAKERLLTQLSSTFIIKQLLSNLRQDP
jgi:hypothetical protein